MLAAKAVTRPSVDPAATRASCAEACARLRPPVVTASVRVTSRTGPAGAGGVVGGRPGPSGVGVDVLDDPAVLRQYPLPPVGRAGRRLATAGCDDDGVDRPGGFDHGAQRLGGVAKAVGELDAAASDRSGLQRGGQRRAPVADGR